MFGQQPGDLNRMKTSASQALLTQALIKQTSRTGGS